MSSPDIANATIDPLEKNLHSLQLLENKKLAKERSINNKKFVVAVSDGNVELVNSLLEKVDINFKDEDECSPLHWAVEAGDVKIIEKLVSSGAHSYSKNNDSKTPIDIANQLNRSDIVNILEASVNEVDKPKITDTRKTPQWKIKQSSQYQEIWINPIHGYIYQLKVLMLFLHRGLSHKYSFRLGTEIKEAKKFDDLVFEFVRDNKKVYRLLQAKHKFDESKKITTDKLLKETKGDYSLIKYFYSFQDCIKGNFFKDGTIKDVIICTNIDFDWDDLHKFGIEMRKVEDEDDILDIKSDEKQSMRYKFTNTLIRKLKQVLKPGDTDNDIKNFLNHLVFAVNQPNEEELGQIVKMEIGREMGFLDSENAFNNLLIKMIDLSLGKRNSMFLTHREGKKLFDDLKTKIPIWFNTQNPVSSFTGRIKYLERMHEILTKNFYVCISGTGGVGKTELVRKYIADNGKEYNDRIIWINAESYRSAADSFRQLASDKLNISLNNSDNREKHITSIVADVYQFFSKSKSLFIFDNAEKYYCENEFDCGIDQFLPCLPKSCIKPNVIITSRYQKWPENTETVALEAFTANEARELLEKMLTVESNEQNTHLDELGDKVQFLPLALQQAIAYIKMQNEKEECIGSKFGIRDYLEKYLNMAHDLLDFNLFEDSDGKYNKSVLTTWNITFDTLKQKENGQDAIDILNLISYFLPDNISIDLLLIFFTDKEKLSSAIGLLKQYSIVSVQHKALSVHRLVQQVTRIKLQKQNEELKILESALKALLMDNVNHKNVDHVISMWKFASSHSKLFKEYLIVAEYIISTLLRHGSNEKAISLGSEVSKLFNAFSKKIDYLRRYLSIRSLLAQCILVKGDYNTALEELQEIYKIQTTTLGLEPSNMDVLGTQYYITGALEYLGRYREALESYFEQLDGLRVNLDECDPRILLAKSKITIYLCEQGRHQEALPIFQEVYDDYKKMGSDRNEEMLVIENTIALAHSRLNRKEEAFKIFQRMRKDEEEILAKSNINSYITKFNLAEALANQGENSSALEIFQELFDIQIEKFGVDHPETIQLSSRIGSVLLRQGELEKALQMLKNALCKQQNILGFEHPETLDTQAEVASALFQQKKYQDAIELCENLLEKQTRVLGSSHPKTFNSRRMIVVNLSAQKRYDLALELSLEVLQDSERTFGENDSFTLIDKANVGLMYCQSKHNHSKGLGILREVLKAQESSLGKDHPDCQKMRNNIATVQVNASGDGNDYLAKLKIALEEGADINEHHERGSTILHNALNRIDEPAVNFLLQKGAEIFITNNEGETPLHVAVMKGQEKFVTMLLQKIKPSRLNDFIDAKTISTGSTALHVAAQLGYFSIVKCLLKNHATFCAKNKDDKTPRDVAKNSKIKKLLKMACEFFDGLKQVHATNVIQRLKGLSPEEFLAVANMRNEQGSTLAQVAILNKHKEVAGEILKMLQSKSK